MLSRRSILASFGVVVAPVVIRTPGLLMPVRGIERTIALAPHELLAAGRVTEYLLALDRLQTEVAASAGIPLRLLTGKDMTPQPDHRAMLPRVA